MKLGFLKLSADERRPYIEQAAVRRNVSPVVLEKDFWVCWLLGILFESEFARVQGRHLAVESFRRNRPVLGGHRPVPARNWSGSAG
jgi:hypothetical protein